MWPPTSPVSCSHFHFTLENPKGHFSTILSISTPDYLRYLRIKRTVIVIVNMPVTWKMSLHYFWNTELFRLMEGVVFLQTLEVLKRRVFVAWHWWLWQEPVVLCGNLKVRQATSQQVFKVTTICMDTRLISVFFATDQSRRPPRSAKIRPMSQQSAAATRVLVYRADWYLVNVSASCPRCSNQPGLSQDCWLAMYI